jgi:hypothetical protein
MVITCLKERKPSTYAYASPLKVLPKPNTQLTIASSSAMDNYYHKIDSEEVKRAWILADTQTIERKSEAAAARQAYHGSPANAKKSLDYMHVSQSMAHFNSQPPKLMPMETAENKHLLMNAQSTMQVR